MTTLKKNVIVQLFLDVTCCNKGDSATQLGNPTTSDRGQCATAYQVGNPPAISATQPPWEAMCGNSI